MVTIKDLEAFGDGWNRHDVDFIMTFMADDCVYKGKEDRFFRAYVELVNKLFPDNPMRKVPYDHEIFHIYFDFKNGAPHCPCVPSAAATRSCGWFRAEWASPSAPC